MANDDICDLTKRNGMAIVGGLRLMAQSIIQMAALIELANQALPKQVAYPLMGDDPPDSGGEMPPVSEVRPAESVELGADQSSPPAIEHAPPPPSGVRGKNAFTAADWVGSLHFLKYMKKAPFVRWTVDQQRETADLFIAHANKEWPKLRMNRWGERFSKFCGA